MGDKNLIISENLREFFYQKLRVALANQEIQTQVHTEFYLVNLLSGFLRSNPQKLLPHQEEKALAIHYLESLQMNPEQSWSLLKYLGDMTLYVAGFFQGNFQRKSLDLNYYMSLGGSAYRRLSHLSEVNPRARSHKEIFQDLAENFKSFVDVLSEISESSQVTNSLDLLKLYERWMSTGSKRLLKKLQLQGIHPLKEEASFEVH